MEKQTIIHYGVNDQLPQTRRESIAALNNLVAQIKKTSPGAMILTKKPPYKIWVKIKKLLNL
jgi:hypothetical protein